MNNGFFHPPFAIVQSMDVFSMRLVFLMDLILSLRPLLFPSITMVVERIVVRATDGINDCTVAKMANNIKKHNIFDIFWCELSLHQVVE